MAQTQIRILHALGTINFGGVETWLMRALRNIDRSRFQMDFCTFGSEPGLDAAEVERLPAPLEEQGVRITHHGRW